MSLFAFSSIFSFGLGSVFGGLIAASPHLGWRWVQWVHVMYVAQNYVWISLWIFFAGLLGYMFLMSSSWWAKPVHLLFWTISRGTPERGLVTPGIDPALKLTNQAYLLSLRHRVHGLYVRKTLLVNFFLILQPQIYSWLNLLSRVFVSVIIDTYPH